MNGRILLLLLVGTAAVLAAVPVVVSGSDPLPPAAVAVICTTRVQASTADCAHCAPSREPTREVHRVGHEPQSQPLAAAPTANQQLAGLLAALDAGDDDVNMVLLLRDLLQAHPELAATFPLLVHASSRSERACARLLQALARCGDAGCQDALATIAADATAAPARRGGALRAIGDVPEPTEATLAALWSHVYATTDRAETALLAFGHGTATLGAHDPDLHRRCCLQIHAALRTATEPRRTGILLKSLASAGYADLVNEAVSFLSATDASVRAIAASVLLSSDGEQVEAIAHDLLRTETDPEVRRIVVRGLGLRARA